MTVIENNRSDSTGTSKNNNRKRNRDRRNKISGCGIPPKLLHHIRKAVNSNGIDSNSPESATIVHDILYQTYPEYKRKGDAESLLCSIEIGLNHILEEPKDNDREQGQKSREEIEEDLYDKEAKLEEQIRVDRSFTMSNLNNTLCNQYVEKSQKEMEEREIVSPPRSPPPPPVPPTAKKRKKKRTKHNASPDPSPAGPNTNALPIVPTPRPCERYLDLGGIGPILTQIRELVELPMLHPHLFSHLGVPTCRGVLLRGPPGCGKTHLAKAIAGELDLGFFHVSSPELVGGVSGESEARVRALFEGAAALSRPTLIFLDELDAIAPRRDGRSGSPGTPMEKRVVAQLLTSMEGLSSEENPVIVVAATNRPDSIDPALRRPGRFDREITMGVPDQTARRSMLISMTKKMRLEGCVDFELLAKKTPGFVGADLKSLLREAGVIAVRRILGDGFIEGEKRVESCSPEQMENLFVNQDDFVGAVGKVQPSSKREGFATVPDVTWASIGALESIREELALSVLEPIQHPEHFEELGIPLPSGVLLYGPPGCGKTLLAKAIASESGANFISIKGPELLDKYVGESERAVRRVFERARASRPCLVFFDELDSLCPKRGNSGESGGVTERVVNQLLTEMDGVGSRGGVFVIAATNRPELIDPAMMRPGRLDKCLYVPLPTPRDRVNILKALSRKVSLAENVDFEKLGMSEFTTGFSGADCAALLREAGLSVLREKALNKDTTPSDDCAAKKPLQIESRHFEHALQRVLPSVSEKDQRQYDRIRVRMAGARTRGGTSDVDKERETEKIN